MARNRPRGDQPDRSARETSPQQRPRRSAKTSRRPRLRRGVKTPIGIVFLAPEKPLSGQSKESIPAVGFPEEATCGYVLGQSLYKYRRGKFHPAIFSLIQPCVSIRRNARSGTVKQFDESEKAIATNRPHRRTGPASSSLPSSAPSTLNGPTPTNDFLKAPGWLYRGCALNGQYPSWHRDAGVLISRPPLL